MITNTVRAIWQRELDLPEIDDKEDFFVLGGHSLIMAKIQDAYVKEFGVDVPMDELFRHLTVESTAALLESQSAARTA